MGIRIRKHLLLLAMRLLYACDRRCPDQSSLGTAAIQKILLISSTAIGDTLLSTPAIHSLRCAYPQAHISLLLNQAYRPLFANNPDVDEILPYAGGFRRFFRLAYQLYRRRFDLALVLHGNEPQATPLMYLSGAPLRFKWPNDNPFRFLLTNATPVRRMTDFAHGIDQRLAVAALAGATLMSKEMILPLQQEAIAGFECALARLGWPQHAVWVGFQAGASTQSRRWPAEHFISLGQRLLAQHANVHIVLTGSPQERPLTSRIATQLASSRVWNAAGDLPLEQVPVLIKRLRVLLTGDTGPMHMAIALHTPVLALFAVSDWRRSGPAYALDQHRVIQKWQTCQPCWSKRCPYENPICMENIGVAEVEKALLDSLAISAAVSTDSASITTATEGEADAHHVA